MKISLIISFYKRIDFLELVLNSLEKQDYRDFEVIVAEDDHDRATVNFLQKIAERLSFKIRHVYQKADLGFRKNEILNKAISMANGEFIIIIDGDCILHRAFLKAYAKDMEPGKILFGRRVLLSHSFTRQLLASKKLNRLNCFRFILAKCSRVEDGLYLPFIPSFLKKKRERGVQGSNMGFFKKDIVAINGFDEDYQKPTAGEDDDIEWRFRAGGYSFQSMKHKAIQYHLFHPFNYTAKESNDNRELMNKKINAGNIFCLNGINKYADQKMQALNEYPAPKTIRLLQLPVQEQLY